jgi:hypothetical protein
MSLYLNASKDIAPGIKVDAYINEIQVWIGNRIEYVWFCNNIDQARYHWVGAVAAAKRLAVKAAARAKEDEINDILNKFAA